MTGFQELKNQNKTVYYSPENGQMQYGWQDIKNNKYYFDTYNGAMTTGQKNIDGNWYLFNNEGQMQRGFKILKIMVKIRQFTIVKMVKCSMDNKRSMVLGITLMLMMAQ